MSTTSPAYFEIIEFIAGGTTPEGVVHFRPSAEAQQRVAELIERDRDCGLAFEEKAELDHFKGSDVASIDPQSGEPVRLFHPRRDRWVEHFYLETVFIVPRTEIGSATVRLLRLNAAERIAERHLLQLLGRFPQSAG